MTLLPHVTLICVDCLHYGQAVNAIQKSLKHITPARTILFSDIDVNLPGIEVVKIPHIYSKKEYSHWMIKELGKQDILTSHVLVIQSDGFVLNGDLWDDAFLDWDYVGAPWTESDGYNVGNGGFSLRSMKLNRALAADPLIKGLHPEDSYICRVYRDMLEQVHGIKFCPDQLAHKFSYELHNPMAPTFGFHQYFHKPYDKEPVVIKRTGAMGDVIAAEPVLEHFHKLGHPVYLWTQPGFMQLFTLHDYPIGDYSKFDKDVIKHRLIDLDMAYEVNPKQLHLKSYFEMCGIADYEIRKPRLKYGINDHNRLFDRYVVIHIDRRETTHRNVIGVDWSAVETTLRANGFTVIQVGKAPHEQVGIYFNTVNEIMLTWLIAGAALFIGVDSGPSNIAVALGIPSVIFFGSVNPDYIHPDLTGVEVLKSECPFNTPSCWHETTSQCGSDCPEIAAPPCTVNNANDIMNAIHNLLTI